MNPPNSDPTLVVPRKFSDDGQRRARDTRVRNGHERDKSKSRSRIKHRQPNLANEHANQITHSPEVPALPPSSPSTLNPVIEIAPTNAAGAISATVGEQASNVLIGQGNTQQIITVNLVSDLIKADQITHSPEVSALPPLSPSTLDPVIEIAPTNAAGAISATVGEQASNVLIGQGNIQQIITVNLVSDLIKAGLAAQNTLTSDPIFWGVGELPPYYIPRQHELERLRHALSNPIGTPLIALEGMGGMGKSTLARAIAYDPNIKQRYPDGVLWATLGPTAREKSVVDAQLIDWGVALGQSDMILKLPTPESKANLLTQHLRNKRLLLILDDVWHSEPARMLMRVRSESCGMLITTRFPRVIADLGIRSLRLDSLQIAEALAVIAASRGRGLEEKELPLAQELVQRLGYHPLAVRLAGAQFRLPGRTWDTILLPLRNQQGAIIDVLELDNQTRETSLSLCIEASIEFLNSDAQAAYRWLSIFAAESSFSTIVINALWQQHGKAFDPMNLEIAPSTQNRLQTLLDVALLEEAAREECDDWNTPTSQITARYRQHLLLRQDGLRRLRQHKEFDQALRCHAEMYIEVMAFDRHRGSYKLIEEHYAQIEIILIRAWDSWRVPASANDTNITYPQEDAYRYLNQVVTDCELGYWRLTGRHTDRILWLTRAAMAAETLGHKKDLMIHWHHLGLAYSSTGEVQQAIASYERTLKVCCELGDHKYEGIILGNLGNAHAGIEFSEKAIFYHEQALNISRAIGDRRSESVWLGNLALDYAHLKNAEKSLDYGEKSLALCRRSGNRRDLGYALSYLGYCHTLLGQPEKALLLNQQGIDLLRRDGDLTAVAEALVDLAEAYLALNQLEEARKNFQEGLNLVRNSSNQETKTRSEWGLGLILSRQGNRNEAVRLMQPRVTYLRQINHAKLDEYEWQLVRIVRGVSID